MKTFACNIFFHLSIRNWTYPINFLLGFTGKKTMSLKQFIMNGSKRENMIKKPIFQKHPVKIEEPNIANEFARHEQWKEKSGLRATPTILVNGYKLPENFKIEDLHFFSDIEI